MQVGLGVQVADARHGQRPALTRGAQERLHQPERRRLAGVVAARPRRLYPAEGWSDGCAAGAGQRTSDLEVRVDARGDLAEELEDVVLAEHDRRVRLLGAHD